MLASLQCDVVVIGAGAAGLMCARVAGLRGRRVVLLDHANTLGQKILISGGGRCNFTNIGAGPANYVSANPHFCRSAMARFTPEDFVALVRAHQIPFYEKKLGQLFCETSAKAIVQLLRTECDRAGVVIQLDTEIIAVERCAQERDADAAQGLSVARFCIRTARGSYTCRSLVIATGGLSLPKLGATSFGYEIATQYGLNIIPCAPALDGFVFAAPQTAQFQGLQGIAHDVDMGTAAISFREAMLFTHHGLSGPVALQTSLHWQTGEPVWINWLPTHDVAKLLARASHTHALKHPKNWLAEYMPDRLATALAAIAFPHATKLSHVTGPARACAIAALTRYAFIPISTVGYTKAEVTRGGVDTHELSSKTMETKKIPGLFFIGEVVDVTGWLGGYNFQWAWASGTAAGDAV